MCSKSAVKVPETHKSPNVAGQVLPLGILISDKSSLLHKVYEPENISATDDITTNDVITLFFGEFLQGDGRTLYLLSVRSPGQHVPGRGPPLLAPLSQYSENEENTQLTATDGF